MPEISIIVPVYRVEKYLRRCLDSILAQVFADFECILVDDGSPDNCPAICDEYASRDNRIKVVHKKNEGTAIARDSGLNRATAEFIMYVDSDDWIEPNALELLYKKQRETGADIVLGNMKNIRLQGSYADTNPEIPDGMPPIAYYLFFVFKGLVAKLYRKSLFRDYIVPNMRIGEDLAVCAQIFSAVKSGKLQKIDEIIYVYDRTTNGVTNNYTGHIKNSSSYLDDASVKARLWVSRYLDNAKQDDSIRLACLYLVYEAIVLYARLNYRNVTKNEVIIFYKDYYRELADVKCRKKILTQNRMIIPIFYFSVPLGKAYVKILDFLSYLKRTVLASEVNHAGHSCSRL